jgi:putative hydrolase of the HAD superfamily
MASSVERNVCGVVFDLVGTLICPARPVPDVYHSIGKQFGSTLSREQINVRFRHAFARANWSDPSHGSQRATWQSIVYDVFQMPLARGELFQALWDYFADPGAWRVFDDVMPVIGALRQRQLALAIGSNFDDRIQAICRGVGLSNVVDQVFWSSQLGSAKPALRFFETIAERLQLAPAQLLMVGDRLEHDVDAPRQAGWNALQLARDDLPVPTADMVGNLYEVAQRV